MDRSVFLDLEDAIFWFLVLGGSLSWAVLIRWVGWLDFSGLCD